MTKRKLPESIETDENKGFSTKRKLIKGSLVAVPVVMTLKSGAAMALTSTEQCIAKNKVFANSTKDSIDKFADSGAGLPFIRTPVQKIELVSVLKDVVTDRWVLTGGIETITNIYQHDGTSNTGNWADTENLQTAFSPDPVNPSVAVYVSPGGAIHKDPAELFKDSAGNYFYNKIQENKDGLVVFDNDGVALNDILGDGPRVGKFAETPNLNDQNHLTGSCWASLNP